MTRISDYGEMGEAESYTAPYKTYDPKIAQGYLDQGFTVTQRREKSGKTAYARHGYHPNTEQRAYGIRGMLGKKTIRPDYTQIQYMRGKGLLDVTEANRSDAEPLYGKSGKRIYKSGEAVTKSAFDIVKSYVGGGKYKSITKPGVKRLRQYIPESPRQGPTQPDSIRRIAAMQTKKFLNAETERTPLKKPKHSLQRIVSEMSPRSLSSPTFLEHRPGYAATNQTKKPVILNPGNKAGQMQIDHINRGRKKEFKLSRKDVFAHESAHLTSGKKKHQRPDKQIQRIERNMRLKARHGEAELMAREEARADVMASKKRGRPIVSGHNQDQGYWRWRHTIEERSGVPKTPVAIYKGFMESK